MRPLSETINEFVQAIGTKKIAVRDMVNHFEDRSIAFFLFICAIPAAIPLPGLGINFIIAAPLLLLTAQQALLRKHVWLPAWLMEKSISTARLKSMTAKAMPWILRAEKIVKPRLQFIAQDGFKPIIGLLGFIMAVSVTIPLPLTNTVPSMGIALMALGVVMKDGMAVLGGALIGLVWVVLVFALFIVLGVEGLDLLKETIKSVF